jgi:hypothetical protein
VLGSRRITARGPVVLGSVAAAVTARASADVEQVLLDGSGDQRRHRIALEGTR